MCEVLAGQTAKEWKVLDEHQDERNDCPLPDGDSGFHPARTCERVVKKGNNSQPVTCSYCLALNAAAVDDHAASEFESTKFALGLNVPVPPGRLSTTRE